MSRVKETRSLIYIRIVGFGSIYSSGHRSLFSVHMAQLYRNPVAEKHVPQPPSFSMVRKWDFPGYWRKRRMPREVDDGWWNQPYYTRHPRTKQSRYHRELTQVARAPETLVWKRLPVFVTGFLNSHQILAFGILCNWSSEFSHKLSFTE